MKIKTRLFGEVEVDNNKIIKFDNGIIGFDKLQNFLLIHDEEADNHAISWLQSVEEPSFALPVMDPLCVYPSYNPTIEDELLASLGELDMENMLVLTTITVPSDITKMTCNLLAPIIINAKNCRAVQVVSENGEYQVKYPVYDILNGKE